MILVKKTAVLSPRGAHGISGVARFECFRDRSDVRINLTGGRKDLYAVVAVGDEMRLVRPCSDRIYLARTDLAGDCAAIVADGETRVLCAGATRRGYDYTPLEDFLAAAQKESVAEQAESVETQEVVKDERTDSDADAREESAAEQAESVETQEAVKDERTDSEAEAREKSAAEEDVKAETVEETGEPAEKTEKVGEEKDEKTKEEKAVSESPKGEEKENGRFFDKIADKIEKLFEENEKDEELTALIPDSRWARVKAEDGWYVVGVVGDPAEFICYGIPDDDATNPPDEREGCRQWLEVEKGGRGYWMMYQSALTGETLTAV